MSVEPNWRHSRRVMEDQIYEQLRRERYLSGRSLQMSDDDMREYAREQALKRVRQADVDWQSNQARQARAVQSGTAF